MRYFHGLDILCRFALTNIGFITMLRFKVILIFFSLFLLYGNFLTAQDLEEETQAPDVNVLYNKQAVGGVFMHTEGWGFFFRKAKILSIYNKVYWEVEAATMHSEKEYKTQNENYPDASSYYFGKLNGMEAVRLGAGMSRMIWRKNDINCIQVDAVYGGGLSLAVLKPVYLEIIQNNPPDQFNLDSQKYDPNNDTPANIYGRASVFDGIGELSFYPGLYGRFGFNFDYANRHNTLKALETGVEVDAYSKVIPMMAYTTNNQIFINLYLSISFGKRWF